MPKVGKDGIGLEMKYFVLNPYKKSAYGAASRKALEAYADAIQEANWQLAHDLRDWVNGIQLEIQKQADAHPRHDRYDPSPDAPGAMMPRNTPHVQKSYIED